MMMRTLTGVVLCLFAAGTLAAENEDRRRYLGAQIGATFSDDADFDAGPALLLSVGQRLGPRFALEGAIQAATLEVADIERDYDLLGVMLNGLYTLRRREKSELYGLGSAVLRHIDFLDENQTGFSLATGLGHLRTLDPRWDLRTELRYQLDFVDPEGAIEEDIYYHWTLSLGLVRRLGERAPVAPPPPPDSDGDGVIDGRDRCPNTPRLTLVNSSGCPLDSDGDGVFEAADKCPNTLPGLTVDATGCPVKAQKLVLRNVQFEHNSTRLTTAAMAILDRVAKSLLDQPNVRAEVGGHTDAVGSDAYNLRLSKERAASVRDYLLSRGIPAERLNARGYGESAPVADNATEEGRATNRRVELKLLE